MMAVLGGIWKRFFDLLPKTPRYIGTVITVNGPGRYTVQLVGGGTLQVVAEGTYTVSDRVFVSDKRIEGEAPALTTINIEI
jgi:hypothetical protein